VRAQEFEFDELCALPEGWNWIPLEGLMKEPRRDIVDGPFGSDLKASEYQSEGIPIARLQNIDRNIFLYKKIQFLSSEKAKQLDRHNFKAGDILLTKLGDPLGKACIVPENIPRGIIVADLVRIRADIKKVDTKYLSYAINSPFIVKQFENHTKGTTRPRVNLTLIRKLPIPVAPITQQEYIVAEIEKQFSRLDETVTALKRIQANLKRYKAAVLKAAVEGKLTEQWRKEHPDVEPADQLLKRILVERRAKWEADELEKMKAKGIKPKGIKPKDDSWKKKYKEPVGPDTANLPGLPEGWVWASLQQVFSTITDGDHQPPPQMKTGIPFLVIGNVRTGVIDLADTRFVSPEYYKAIGKERTPKKGDILYTLVGSYGIAVSIENEDKFCVQRHIGILKPCKSTNISFFKHFLNSDYFFRQATNIATGTAQLTVPLGGLRMVAVPFPADVEQNVIQEEIDRRLSVTEELEATIETNLKRAERLRQTILQQAFAGMLV
jgi:type I restriction enzyme, S subunit